MVSFVVGDGPVLAAKGLVKSFPGVRAVRGVDLTLHAGQVLGLVGENGAGKSTLVKMITGAVIPDQGHLEMLGRTLRVSTPAAALRAGIAAVHQEPTVVPALGAVANVFLGQSMSRRGWLQERAMRARFRQWTSLLGVKLSEDGRAGDLSIGAQQTIEIIRALEHDARVVVMDEPTASLSMEERGRLFTTIDLMRSRGTAVVFISHKLEDVLKVSDTVTVLRNGTKVLEVPATQTDPDGLVAAMLGATLEGVLHGAAEHHRRSGSAADGAVLRVANLNVPGRLSNVELSVRPGEILGVAGLVGSGRTTLLRALGGAEPTATGGMWVDERQVPWPRSPRQGRRLGIALAPEHRRTQGLVMSMTAGENLVLPSLGALSRFGFVGQRRLYGAARSGAPKVGFATERVLSRAGNLSGGNQQKIVLGKLLLTAPRALLVDEPARGVDVGAKGEIFRLLLQLAAQGMAIIMVSEETDELISLADRLIVLRGGEVSARHEQRSASPDEILISMLPVSA